MNIRAAIVSATRPRLLCSFTCFSASEVGSLVVPVEEKYWKGLDVFEVLEFSITLLAYFINLRHYWMNIFYKPVEIFGLRAPL